MADRLRSHCVNSPRLKGIVEGKINATETRPLVCIIDCWISYWVHPAVCPSAAGTAGTVCLDKTIRILSVQRTIVTASRYSHNDVSGRRAKELWKGRGVRERVF